MKVTAREKKIIAAGAILAVAVLIYYAATLLPNGDDLARTVDLKKKMLLKQRESLSREETYQVRLENSRKHLKQGMTRLLPGDNPNVAGAELHKVLKEFADQSAVEITQKNILPAKKPENGIQKVSVRIETTCTPEQLVQFLAAIENYEKFLSIEEFTVAGIRSQRRYEIRPSLTISGYIAAQETKPAEKAATG